MDAWMEGKEGLGWAILFTFTLLGLQEDCKLDS